VALRAEPGFEVIGEANDAREALALAEQQAIDVAIVDVLMP
jgi:YesN/AraC family two-component response regulator